MAMTRSTRRNAANPFAQPSAKRARNSKEVVKLQQLLEKMDINKRPRTSRGGKARKGAPRPAGDVTPDHQAPHNSPNTYSRSLSVDFESSLPPFLDATCAASPHAPVFINSPAGIQDDAQSTSNDVVSSYLRFPLCDKHGSC
jgi:hypothetical protein